VDIVIQQDDRLFPDDTTLLISHVVDLVEHDPSNFARYFGASVKHAPQNLCGHYKTRSRRVYGHITSHQANVFELLEELSVFLIAQRLNGCCVNDTLLGFERFRNAVFGNYCFAGGRVRRHKNRLFVFQAKNSFLLKWI
jgi:hypothetical protein